MSIARVTVEEHERTRAADADPENCWVGRPSYLIRSGVSQHSGLSSQETASN